MTRMGLGLVACAAVVAGCAHTPLPLDALDHVEHPAFVARVLVEAGPHATVFRDDASWGPKLKTMSLDAKEADRRLADKLANGRRGEKGDVEIPSITRFEVADALRGEVLEKLPKRHPWTVTLNPAQVSSALESFLVTEEKAVTPEYERLKPLGADVVIELVIEEYGMRGEKGVSGCYVVGTARLFRLGGSELYHRAFFSDELRAGLPGVDPFAVAKNPTLFRDRLRGLLSAVAERIAKDLNPAEFPEP